MVLEEGSVANPMDFAGLAWRFGNVSNTYVSGDNQLQPGKEKDDLDAILAPVGNKVTAQVEMPTMDARELDGPTTQPQQTGSGGSSSSRRAESAAPVIPWRSGSAKLFANLARKYKSRPILKKGRSETLW